MPQEMNILRCSSCKTYQVHIIKKAKKWQCKICNFKQTFKQVYFKGSGKDCRVFVQKLNLMKEHEVEKIAKSFDECNNINDNYTSTYPEQLKLKVTENKWAKYLDSTEEIESNIFKASTSKNIKYNENDDKIHLNDNIIKSSQSKSIKSDLSDESDCTQNFVNDNEEDYDNSISKEIDSSKNNDFHSKNITEIKCKENIFDDNEDFDISIDF
ncbi:MRN complex-interacting protein [Apis laboriosa]|uniref:MRN complex-interacting protein n=1 Tax=Apis dorsata TaxID=7462 RepID=UPI0012936FD6|nr:MRN complex-interacting protein [Apis dorsata]XP_043784170.1 MRN complex-interacting protein [Apis laboriosa]